MKVNRSWIAQFYQECGREISLAYNVFNSTNGWGLTLSTGIVAAVLVTAIKVNGSQVTFLYPNFSYWYVIIVAWILMIRFYVRSCLALVNMYRWNTLIYASSKILSLPENDPALPVFERNFIKKAKAYYYEWQSPVPQSKLVRECFRLIYIWFFIILFGLILWGAIVLNKDNLLWLGGILLVFIPTGWEIYSFFTYRGFKYKVLDLEDEPEITSIWLDKEVEIHHQPINEEQKRNDLLKKNVISQALTFFIFGLLSILTFHISSKTIPSIDYAHILDTIKYLILWLFTWLLAPLGFISIGWSIVLFTILFKWRIVERLNENKFRQFQSWSNIFYWPALIAVFGISFWNILTRMIQAGMNIYYLFIVYALAILILVSLLIHRWRSPI